jgi:hypothetical protein
MQAGKQAGESRHAMAGPRRQRQRYRVVLAAGLVLAGLLAAAPAWSDPPPPPACLRSPGGGAIAGPRQPINNCVLRNGQWIAASAAFIGQPEPPFPPPGVDLAAGSPGEVVLHDSLSPEERAGIDGLDQALAQKLGGEGRAAALDYILGLQRRGNLNVRGAMIEAYAKGYRQPLLTPDIEALLAARYWEGERFNHRILVELPQNHRYRSRALFERIAQELAVTRSWDAQRFAAALLNYDQPDAPDLLVARLDRLPPPAVGEIALYLLRRGDPRGIAVARQAMALVDGTPEFRGYYLQHLGNALGGAGTPAAYGLLADLLRQIQQGRPEQWDAERQSWSGVLLRAPRQLHLELGGIDPAPAGAAPETLRALATLLRQRPQEEALVTERTAQHLRRLIELGDVAAVRDYAAQGFDLNRAIDDGTIPVRSSIDMFETLLRGGADPHTRDSAGNTWLHLVCAIPGGGPEEWEAARARMAQDLIAAGADVNATNIVGLTPLMLAVQFNHPQILSRLLQAGARTGPVDRAGRNAMIIAIDAGYGGAVGAAKLQHILREGGADWELGHRLRNAPWRHPLWCLAFIAAAAFGLGYGLVGIHHRIGAALGRPRRPSAGLGRRAWLRYFALCGVIALLLGAGWVDMGHASGDAALGVVLLYAFSLLCLAAVAAIGAFMGGLHSGLRTLGRALAAAESGRAG